MADCMAAASQAMMEPMEEDEEEVDKELGMGEGSSTADLVPKQVLAPGATMPAVPRFCIADLSDQMASRGLAASSRAQGKVPTIQADLMAPAKTDKELVC